VLPIFGNEKELRSAFDLALDQVKVHVGADLKANLACDVTSQIVAQLVVDVLVWAAGEMGVDTK